MAKQSMHHFVKTNYLSKIFIWLPNTDMTLGGIQIKMKFKRKVTNITKTEYIRNLTKDKEFC